MRWEFGKNFKIWWCKPNAWKLYYWRYESKNLIWSRFVGEGQHLRKYCCVEPAVFKTILALVWRRIFLVLFFDPNRLLNLFTTHTEVLTVSLVPLISLPCFAAIPWIFTQSWRDMPAFRNGRVDDNWFYKARHLECFILATSSSRKRCAESWLALASENVCKRCIFNSLCWCLFSFDLW